MFERRNVYFMEEENKTKACCFHHISPDTSPFPIAPSLLIIYVKNKGLSTISSAVCVSRRESAEGKEEL